MTKKSKKPVAKKPVAKKPVAKKPVVKQAAAAKPRVTSAAPKAVETPKAVNVFAGSEVVKDFLSAGSQEAKRAQERAFSFGRDHFEKWTAGADKTARKFTESFALSKDGVDALVEYSKIATDLGKEYQEEVTAEWNEICAETVETAKELLACRTLNDYIELQNRLVQTNVNRAVAQSARLTDLWYKLTTEAAEPISAQVNRATQKLNKTLAA